MFTFDKKRLIPAFCLFAILVFMITFLNRLSAGTKGTILSYVRENKDFLDNYVHNENTDIIVVLESHPTKGKYKGGYVDFLCGAFGIGPDGVYFGFYYSPNDIPMNIAYNQPLEKTKTGYIWDQESGNCFFYTERIVMNYYYYEYES